MRWGRGGGGGGGGGFGEGLCLNYNDYTLQNINVLVYDIDRHTYFCNNVIK